MTTYQITFPINYLKGTNKQITKQFADRQAARTFALDYMQKHAFSNAFIQEVA
jgi:hypothetical protein